MRLLTFVTTWEEYAAVLATSLHQNLREDDWSVPVISRTGFMPGAIASNEPDLDRTVPDLTVAQSWHLIHSGLSVRSDGMDVIVGIDGDPTSLAAACLALFLGRKLILVQSWDSLTLPPNTRSVLLLGPKERFDADAIAQARRQWTDPNSGIPTLPWGVVTARTPEAVSFVVAKLISRRNRRLDSAVMIAHTEPERLQADAPLRMITKADHPLPIYDTEPVSVTSLTLGMGHGSSDFLHLGRNSYCGLAKMPEETHTLAQPACGYGLECPRSRHARPAHLVPSESVLLNTCLAFSLFGGLYHTNYSLALSFLEGWADHVIAPDQVKQGSTWELIFAWVLLRSGVSFGETVRLMNLAVISAQLAPPAYLLLGDPATRYATGTNSVARIEVVPSGAGQRAKIVSEGYLACVCLSIRTPIRSIWVLPIDPYTARRDIRTAIVESESGFPALYFMTLVRGDLAGCQFEILSRDLESELQQIRKSIQALIDNLPVHKCHGLVAAWAKDQLLQVASCGKRLAEARWRPTAARSVFDRIDKLQASLDQKQGQVLCEVLKMVSERYYTPDEYIDHVVLANFRGTTCPCCGTAATLESWNSPVREVNREITQCPRCAAVLDQPSATTLSVRVLAPSFVGPGTSFSVRVELHNHGSRDVSGVAGVRVDRLSQFSVQYTPLTWAFRLRPGGRTELSGVVALPQGVQPHQYDLRAAVIAEGDLHLAGAPIFVCETDHKTAASDSI